MSETFNVYCDESCHLESDSAAVMALGAIWCPLDTIKESTQRIREIKARHAIPVHSEIKWTKISPGNLQLYLDVVDYFFDTDHLFFRALVAAKDSLRHADYNQSHDDWYYKMYFDMIKWILEPESKFRIYLDIKDSRGGVKVAKLHDVLASSIYDFSRSIVERLQIVRSHDLDLMQIADILIGAVAAANRGVTKSPAKQTIVERIRKRSRYSLQRSTLLREKKINLFLWKGREA
jgi:hypothetical protein